MFGPYSFKTDIEEFTEIIYFSVKFVKNYIQSELHLLLESITPAVRTHLVQSKLHIGYTCIKVYERVQWTFKVWHHFIIKIAGHHNLTSDRHMYMNETNSYKDV
jgi:hypothetical protein